MAIPYQLSDEGTWYMSGLASKVVAKTGIPSDRHHLGKLIIQSLQETPNFVLQINGATGESETFASVLKRSIKCAIAFQRLGLKMGDVIDVLAPNNLDIAIVMYAAFYMGYIFAGVDSTLGSDELKSIFVNDKPRVVFCQPEKVATVKLAIDTLKLDSTVMTFGKDEKSDNFTEFLDKYGEDVTVNDFVPTNLDPDTTIAFLMSTSGSTGIPKGAAITHTSSAISIPYVWYGFTKFPTPTRMTLVLSPIQWYSAVFQYIHCPILKITRLQSSSILTLEHIYYLINHYKPTCCIFSVNLLSTVLKKGNREKCDLTCFEDVLCGGSVFNPKINDEMKEASPNTRVSHFYGLSETNGILTRSDPTKPNTLGRQLPHAQFRLVDINTMTDITEPNVPGELWCKGPTVMKEYYNRPEETAATIIENGWLRTGDILYCDENCYFYFVDRLKLLLKYKSFHVSSIEIENIIIKHPAVFEVVVTGIPHDTVGDLPVAFISTHSDKTVSAEEIKDLVRASLSDAKQLRGGVVFLDKLPVTSTSKIDRPKLKEMAKEMKHLFVNFE